MMTYLIQVNVALIFSYAAYSWFLKQETNFRFTRLYLLSALVTSLFIPLVNLDSLSSLFINENSRSYEYWLPDVVTRARPIQEVKNTSFTVWNLLLIIYLLGVTLTLLRIIIQLVQLRRLVRSAKMKQDEKGWYYILYDQPGSFSFFNYVFLGSKSWYSEFDKQNILAHERAHVRCGHSIDVILVQIMTALVWFNPIIYWYKNTLEQLHEYEADQIASGSQKDEYCELLLRDTINTAQLGIANHFNKSLTLKRITMINSIKHKISGNRKLGLLLSIVLIIISISCEEKVMMDIKKAAGQSVLLTEYPQEVQDAVTKIKSNNPKADVKVYGLVRTEDLQELDFGNQTPTMVFKSDDPDYQLYAILGSEEVELPVGAMYEMQNGKKIYTIVEQAAQPKNGMTDFYEFIGKNLKYPEQARRMGVEGRVFVKFLVDESGKLSDFKVIRGIGAGCDAEALRVLSLSPEWNPGRQGGKAINSSFNLAVIFKLENTPPLSSDEQIEVPVGTANKVYVEPNYEHMKVQIQKFYRNGDLYLEGRVLNQKDNTAIPGVNIIFKGRTEGTSTDSNGTFKIKAPVTNGLVVFSFVGFSSEEYSF